MSIFFYIVPFIVSILAVITKRKIVNCQSGRKYAYREMAVDGIRVILISIISFIANILWGNNVPVWSLIIDFFMMIIYLLPLLQKNYDYADRKAFGGIWASCIILISIAVAMFQMLTGTFNVNDTTLLFCFIKGILYFLIATWCCFTTGKSGIKNKIKSLFCGLMDSWKSYHLSNIDYYMFAFLEIFIFIGMTNYFAPKGIFGLHEIMNKKYLKGILFIFFGNVCLFLKDKINEYGDVIILAYVFAALLDILIYFINSKKLK